MPLANSKSPSTATMASRLRSAARKHMALLRRKQGGVRCMADTALAMARRWSPPCQFEGCILVNPRRRVAPPKFLGGARMKSWENTKHIKFEHTATDVHTLSPSSHTTYQPNICRGNAGSDATYRPNYAGLTPPTGQIDGGSHSPLVNA